MIKHSSEHRIGPNRQYHNDSIAQNQMARRNILGLMSTFIQEDKEVKMHEV
jgi:hypothetical protein